MSKKLLLVYDDYSEMIRTQTELMKIGFDIVGVVNEVLMSERLLIFNPDLVLASGRGGKVSAISVAQKLKENPRFHGKSVLLLPNSQRPTMDELQRIRMDALVEAPAAVHKIISVLARILDLDADQLIEKYRKVRIAEGAPPEEVNQIRVVRDRASRYEKALKGISIDTKSTSFDRAKVKARLDDLKKDWDIKDLEQQDELRKQFVEALFKK